jgi:hypothetical protein
MVYARTATSNRAVLSFHESCGLVTHALLPRPFHLDDGIYDAVEHRLTREMWPRVEAMLAAKASRVARLLQRGEHVQKSQ